MQVFLCHSNDDKDIVEPIASWLDEKGVNAWLDKWRMTVGDSLIEKIGEGIESSDRLVVFLSLNSIDSNWVRKEVATGLVMELAEDKGLGEKFVIPALLQPCKVPIMLRDKLYADFTNKAFEAACEELYQGILDRPIGPQKRDLENRILRINEIAPIDNGKFGLIVEFGVRVSPTEGLHIGMDLGTRYKNAQQWFGPPNNPAIPTSKGGVFQQSATREEPPIYARKFSSPNITSTKSYYLYFESDEPFRIQAVQYLDFYDRKP